ncbi:MAG: hypothetical protein ABIQ11_10520 [Saprospiraceae bacterium]
MNPNRPPYFILLFTIFLLRDCYRNHSFILGLFLINLCVSLLTAIWVIADAHWILRPMGLFLYGIWNVLMIIIMLIIYRYHKTENTQKHTSHFQYQST